nr:putative integron gene cassette protein [uncultured bacterium]
MFRRERSARERPAPSVRDANRRSRRSLLARTCTSVTNAPPASFRQSPTTPSLTSWASRSSLGRLRSVRSVVAPGTRWHASFGQVRH